MARLFYHKPKYAILDECTSGVTIDMEQRFCNRVKVRSGGRHPWTSHPHVHTIGTHSSILCTCALICCCGPREPHWHYRNGYMQRAISATFLALFALEGTEHCACITT